tara:strand:+ start:160 stop:708 length:549 start_codon:yes stop_codon:yes gene_type:complete
MPSIKSYFIKKIELKKLNINDQNNDNFENIIINDINQFEILIKNKYKFNDWNINYIKKLLKNSCIAVTFFENKNLAHIRWISTIYKSKKYIETWRIKINWDNEACWGNAFTLPKYRNKGLNKLSIRTCIVYLKSIGKQNVFFSVQKNNFVNIKSYEKYKPINIFEGYCLYFNRFINFKIKKR